MYLEKIQMYRIIFYNKKYDLNFKTIADQGKTI